MDKIKGLIFEELKDDKESAEKELDTLVEECLIIMRIGGQEQPYCFDITQDRVLRNLILANMSDDYEKKTEGN
tara:strand:+ start:4785 stop:5003 length:219 start_codon:yes stop_codon:yes gene_type:complete